MELTLKYSSESAVSQHSAIVIISMYTVAASQLL